MQPRFFYKKQLNRIDSSNSINVPNLNALSTITPYLLCFRLQPQLIIVKLDCAFIMCRQSPTAANRQTPTVHTCPCIKNGRDLPRLYKKSLFVARSGYAFVIWLIRVREVSEQLAKLRVDVFRKRCDCCFSGEF